MLLLKSRQSGLIDSIMAIFFAREPPLILFSSAMALLIDVRTDSKQACGHCTWL